MLYEVITSTLTGKGFSRIGIVSHPNLFSGSAGNFNILDAQVSIRPQESEEAIAAMVRQMADEGFQAFLGCRVAFNTARELGLEAVFLESGKTSLRAALREAMRIIKAKEQEKLQAAQLAAIIVITSYSIHYTKLYESCAFISSAIPRSSGCAMITSPFIKPAPLATSTIQSTKARRKLPSPICRMRVGFSDDCASYNFV